MTTKITDKNISTIANKFVQWQSVITADGSTATNATDGQGYFIDTTSNTHTINLPSSPSIGDSVAIKDYAGTFATNNLTIGRNGKNIQGVANNSLISSARAGLTLVYVDTTRGWVYSKESNVGVLYATYITATGGTVTESGDFKIHSFTGDGCFAVSQVGNPLGGGSNVDYLVVAGGGTGAGFNDGGGGAGGYRTTFPSPGCNAGAFPISATTYPITIGGGGATSGPASGTPSIFSTITSAGGGGGGCNTSPGTSGGSGGGGGANGNTTGGSGNTPPVSPSQGNTGGAGSPGGGGGGGGIVVTGSAGSPGGNGGAGGNGSSNSISGSPVTYAGGGGGGAYPSGTGGTGGTGGGGSGQPGAGGCAPALSNGTTNTGGGGGGKNQNSGNRASGGSGIVIIRYKFQ